MRMKGKWITVYQDNIMKENDCSLCGGKLSWNLNETDIAKFCPKCGAEMDPPEVFKKEKVE